MTQGQSPYPVLLLHRGASPILSWPSVPVWPECIPGASDHQEVTCSAKGCPILSQSPSPALFPDEMAKPMCQQRKPEKGTTCVSVSGARDPARHRSGEVGDAANTDSLQGSNTRFQNKAPTWESPICRGKTHTRVSHTQAQLKVKRINSRQNPPSSVMCHHHPLSSGEKQNTNELDVL